MPLPKGKIQTTNQDMRILKVVASLFFIVIMAVFPLYVPYQYFGLIRYKTNFFYIATAVFAGLVVPFLAYNRFQVKDYFIKGEPKRPISVPEWALLAFVVLALISALASPHTDTVWLGADGRYEGFWAFLCYTATFFLIARFYKPQRMHFLIVAVSAILVSLYACLQFVGLDFLNLFPFTLQNPGYIDAAGNPLFGPLTATFRTTLGNTNVVAAYCSITVPLFAAFYATEESRWRFLYLAGDIMSFILLLIAGSGGDGGKVGILAAMVILIPYWISSSKRLGRILVALGGWCVACVAYQGYLMFLKVSPKLDTLVERDHNFLMAYSPPSIWLFIVVAAVLACMGAILIYFINKWPEKLMKRLGIVFLAVFVLGGVLAVEIIGSRLQNQPGSVIWQAREMLHGRLEDDFGSARGWVWKRGISVIPNNPLLGTGPDTFYQALGYELQAESFGRYGVVFDKAHNTFIQIAVCMGVPALIAFLTFLLGLFVPAVKRAFRRPLLLAFGAAALSYLVQCLFEVDMPVDKPFLWALLGIMGVEIWRDKAGA